MPKEKKKEIYLDVDKIFKPLDKKEAKKVIAKRYNIEDKFILTVGGANPNKNIGRIIRAYHLICHEFPEEFKLVILGDSEDNYEVFGRLAQKLSIADKIIFTEYVSKRNLPFFYNACECFFYPSLYDRFGLPLLEAASCGTPIITSKISEIQEILGNCCIYVNPYDIINMAQNLYDTMRNEKLREELSLKSLEYSRRYSWQNTSQQILKSYKKLL
ncbi:glycosyltransferase family 4 protein [Geosporobacter ferrireducens]|uniref:Glycosyl transferase family 1 domain-containing protein n=1 Tax=Geosporobacter ferrireducens TaxID=1424294 RepID=A0A1D8GCF7_9FIRM|nr:glycosyltransferase family 1 protein [Geosporobacter ferrireducens]AOT68586.1 hypothetical protein Gferi_02630 [Geosporobacter ferrireducens]